MLRRIAPVMTHFFSGHNLTTRWPSPKHFQRRSLTSYQLFIVLFWYLITCSF